MKLSVRNFFLFFLICFSVPVYAQNGEGHSVASNVEVLAESFQMPQLNRSRRIWIYLPPDYETSSKRYPVLYMQDGQNLFDKAIAYEGNEWRVDEALNAIYDEGLEGAIVIGIEHGDEARPDEYAPWVKDTDGAKEGGQGDEYVDFLVKTLKPYVDENYRTLSDREHTGIAGSSLGGLISYYAALKYPEVFGKVGVISPAFWFNPEILDYTIKQPYSHETSFYFATSEEEGDGMIGRINEVKEALLAQGHAAERIKTVLTKTGGHNEIYFGQRFPDLYRWLYNPQKRSDEEPPVEPPVEPEPPTGIEDVDATELGIYLYPNPVQNWLTLTLTEGWQKNANGYFMDVRGQRLGLPQPLEDGMRLSVEALPQGIFYLVVQTEKQRTVLRVIKL